MTRPTDDTRRPDAPVDVKPEVIADLDVPDREANDLKGGCCYGTVTGVTKKVN